MAGGSACGRATADLVTGCGDGGARTCDGDGGGDGGAETCGVRFSRGLCNWGKYGKID